MYQRGIYKYSVFDTLGTPYIPGLNAILSYLHNIIIVKGHLHSWVAPETYLIFQDELSV